MIALNVPATVIQDAFKRHLFDAYEITLSRSALDLIWSFVVACQSIGALIACLFIVPFEKSFGTRKALLVINNVGRVRHANLFPACCR